MSESNDHSDESSLENEPNLDEGMDHTFGFGWVNQIQWVHPSEWVHPTDIPHQIKDVQERLHKSFIRQWRTAITGDPERWVFL